MLNTDFFPPFDCTKLLQTFPVTSYHWILVSRDQVTCLTPNMYSMQVGINNYPIYASDLLTKILKLDKVRVWMYGGISVIGHTRGFQYKRRK